MMEQENDIEALSHFFIGCQIAPYYADNYFGMIEYYINHQRFEEAYNMLNQAKKQCLGALWCSVYDINAFYVEYYQAICEYYYNQDKYKALGYLAASMQKNNKFDGVTQLYAQIIKELMEEKKND